MTIPPLNWSPIAEGRENQPSADPNTTKLRFMTYCPLHLKKQPTTSFEPYQTKQKIKI